ncbi:MAG TPA: hypothetical protein VF219_23455 [Vicinamibacterales bacterium]
MDVPRFTRAELNALVDGELDAEGNLDVVADALKEWLGQEDNRLLPEAALVYRAWLDAGGRLDNVGQPIQDWLAHENNRLLPEASFVFRAWLQAGGRFVFVRKQVYEWVRTHSLERDAVYLLKYVVKQRVLPDDVTLKILGWCGNFADDPDAIWRLNSLSAHISADLLVEAVRASESVLEPLFANPDLPGVTRSQVTTVLGNLWKLEHLGSHPVSRELDSLLCRWMNHPQSFEPSARHAPYHQIRPFLVRLLAAAESEASTPELSPLIEWVGCWDERMRLNCKDLVKRLRVLRHNSTGGRPRRKVSS